MEDFTNAPNALKILLSQTSISPKQYFQSMPMTDVLEHFTSVNYDAQKKEMTAGRGKLRDISMTFEDLPGVKSIVAEKIVHDLILKLIDLYVALENFDVPQLWVGSSVGISINLADFEFIDNFTKNNKDIVDLYIFDWGRSELEL